MQRVSSWGPLLLSWLILAGLLFYLIGGVLKSCGGHFGYPMDDTYIHMAMAKAFSQHGVWGLTHYEFSSTSSSLLYTSLLAGAYLVTGIHELTPLILNVIFGFLLLYLCDSVLKRAALAAAPRFCFLALIIFGMPLAPEVMAGMEHVLHSILTIAFVYCAVNLLTGKPTGRWQSRALLLLAALTVLARYEALALVGIAAVLFFLQRKRWYAIALVSVASLPVAAFGIYSVLQGWFPVPNSIVAKASRPEKSQVAYVIHWAEQMYATPSVAFLFVAGAVLLYLVYTRKRTIWNTECLTMTLFLCTALLHMQFARVGWFYRYEAYLVVFGLYACALHLQALNLFFRRSFATYGAFFVLAAVSFESRAIGALWLTPWAARNIYEQQYQMGRFLAQNYPGVTVVMNDIGAAAYLSDSRIVDLYGLATIEVARAKIHHQFTQEFRRTLAVQKYAKIAIIYPGMYRDVGGVPPEWIPVGYWTIAQNQICWGDTVGFYAIDPAYRARLSRIFGSFRPSCRGAWCSPALIETLM